MRALDSTLAHFFRSTAPVRPGDGLVVAFSGGPDSTALLLGLTRLSAPGGPLQGVRTVAAHLDHGLDPGSRERADRAAALAHALGARTVLERRPVGRLDRAGDGIEAAGRRVRYEFLDDVRRAEEAAWIVTAHHRRDQAETVLLRILQGSGIEGLAAMPPVRGRLARPLLPLDPEDLEAVVRDAGLEPIDDPTNRDVSLARNRVRHGLLRALERAPTADSDAEPGPIGRLVRLADAAAGARAKLEERLERWLGPELLADASAELPTAPPTDSDAVAVRLQALAALPDVLLPHALALLHRRAGAPYPAGAPAHGELARQLGARCGPGRSVDAALAGRVERIGCDCGGGWRWEEAGGSLVLRPPDEGDEPPPARPFSYTLEVPGELEIPELGLSVRVRREPVAAWMFRGSKRRAALALPFDAGREGDSEPERTDEGRAGRLRIRSRRPGDRLRPLGAPGTRKLKDLLIDRRIPRERRDRLPLLCLGERIAWVPGVTVDEAFRVPPDAERTWVAEVLP